jgi:2-polyprenyl-6-hydroxyphenyl methylase/3-demethylubiquinone-9 3-methyltransferase
MIRNNLAFYDQQAAEWWHEDATIAPLNRLNPLRFQYFDSTIPDWQGLKVLDVGCGGGFTCEFLARRGAEVWGVDQSFACVEAAKAHAQQMGLTIHYQRGIGSMLIPASCTLVLPLKSRSKQKSSKEKSGQISPLKALLR